MSCLLALGACCGFTVRACLLLLRVFAMAAAHLGAVALRLPANVP